MILEESNVLLLDEPTRNFSPLSGPVIQELLSAFGGAILSVSHDRLYLEEVCQNHLRPHSPRVWNGSGTNSHPPSPLLQQRQTVYIFFKTVRAVRYNLRW